MLFRTAEGTKLLTSVLNEHVVFEADDHTVAEGWSVVLRGTAKPLSTTAEIDEAERAGLYPWVATRKLRYVRIMPDTLTGRRFVFAPNPTTPRSSADRHTQYGTRARYWRIASAANNQPNAVRTSTTIQCRSS